MIGSITSIWNAVPEAYNTIKSGANKTLDFIQNTVPPDTTIGFGGMNLNPVDAAITLDSTPVFKVNDGSVMTMAPEGVYESDYFDNPYDSIYGAPEEVQGMTGVDNFQGLGPIYISNPQPSYLNDDTFMSDNMDLTYNPTGIDTADDRFRREAAANLVRNTGNTSSPNTNTNPSGGSVRNTAVASAVPSAPVLRTRTFPFTSRTPSGTVYAPDLSAYNDSSLFNYAGPGGLAEYTYGQGLRTDGADYSIFGSPANIANPYFAGQFKEPQGPADAAINMPAVELPEGVQPVTPTEVSADVSMPGFVGGMLPGGITPRPPNVGTVFPSPGVGPTLTQSMIEDAAIDVDRINAMDNQLQNQINTNRVISNIASAPIAGAPAMDDTADIERGMLTSQRGTTMDDTADIEAGMSRVPTDMQRYLDDFEARGIRDRTAEIMDYAANNNRTVGGVTIFDEGDPRQIIQDAILNPEPRREYKPVYGGIDGIPVELGPERSLFKPDEIDIPTPPFRPEGVEGEDFYQDVTGNFFAMEDDLGTQPLTEATQEQPLYQIPDRTYGTEQAIVPSNYETFESIKPRELTETELEPDVGELTSGRMAYLDDAMSAIDAKYEGSKTDASAEAELKEILNATLNAFGGSGSSNARGIKGNTVPADIPNFLDYDITRDNANYEAAVNARDAQLRNQLDSRPVYERENIQESLFQNPVVAEIPLDPYNKIDQIVARSNAQDARVAEVAATPPPPRVTPANVTSIFNPGPPNMNQIVPMVARTQNNMTVPVMRDSALDKRYGGPMRFGR